jgi:putative ABC transport system permease protein
MTTLDMAIRNLGRNKRRSALASLSVFISIFLVVFADGLVHGLAESMTRNATKNETGHVSVVTREYRAKERFAPVAAAIPDSGAVAGAIRAMPDLAGKIDEIAERVRFGVVLSSPSGTKAAIGLAGDPDTERRLLMLDRALLPGGAYLGSPGTAIVGARLAAALGLKVGDAMKVVAAKADYGLGFKKFRIAGLYETGLDTFDGSTFQIGLSDAREFLGLGKGASQVIVMLKESRDSDKAAGLVAAGLASRGLGGLSVRSWTELGDIARMASLMKGIYFWIEVIIAFLGAFIIANVMTMVVLERRREIGILKSMGMDRRTVLALFLAEGTLLGVIGSAAAAVLGTAFNALLSVKGLDFSSITRGSGIPMDNVIRPAADVASSLGFFAMGVVVAAVVAFLPARGAATMDPIEAIRAA